MTRESYYDYMGRRMREEDIKNMKPQTISTTQMFEHQMKELNASYYSCINRIKELVEENQELKLQIEELKNNANI
jgi:regulator of replication initiation timing